MQTLLDQAQYLSIGREERQLCFDYWQCLFFGDISILIVTIALPWLWPMNVGYDIRRQ